MYLGLGWLALVAPRPLWLHVPLCGLLWLLGGGIAYTADIVFYLAKRLACSHFIWRDKNRNTMSGSSCTAGKPGTNPCASPPITSSTG